MPIPPTTDNLGRPGVAPRPVTPPTMRWGPWRLPPTVPMWSCHPKAGTGLRPTPPPWAVPGRPAAGFPAVPCWPPTGPTPPRFTPPAEATSTSAPITGRASVRSTASRGAAPHVRFSGYPERFGWPRAAAFTALPTRGPRWPPSPTSLPPTRWGSARRPPASPTRRST